MSDALKTIPLFHAVPPAELDRGWTLCESPQFRRGEVIFEEGQPASHVWVVKRGWVQLVRRTPGRDAATIFAMTPDEAICGVSAFEHDAYSATAVAATETHLVKIPAALFSSWLDRYPAFAHEVLRTCCHRIRRMAETLTLAHAPVEQRVAYMLLRLRGSFGQTIPLTHQELARMIGARWETCIRTLAVMKRRGWVASGRGRMTILQPTKLRTLLVNGHCPPSSHSLRPAPSEIARRRARNL